MDSISYINLGKGNHPIDAVTINGLTLTSQEKNTWNNKQDALTFDSIPTVNSDNIVKSGDLYDVFYENEEVTSAALNDLNDRLLNIEGKPIITTSDEIIQGWINQEPKTLDLDKRYKYFAFNIYESCILKINTYYKGDQEYPKLSTVTHYVVVDINPSTSQYSISAAYMFGDDNNGYSVFEPYPYMNGNTQYYPIRLCVSSDNTTFRLEFRTRIDSGDTSPKRVVEVSILKGSTSYLENYSNISTTYPQKCSAAWTMVKDSVSWVEYDSTSHELKVIDGLGSSSVITSASTIVADGGGYIKPSTGIPASHIASGVIPTESTVSGWGFTKNAAPGKLTTTSTTALSTATNEALSGNISLHKIAKTGTYSDLVGKPDLPLAAYFNPANETMYFFKSTTDRDSFVADKTQTSLAMFSAEMSEYIEFVDPNVLSTLLANNIGDGVGVTKRQASLSNVGTIFQNNTNIKSFPEGHYFGNTFYPGAFSGCTNLIEVSLPDKMNSNLTQNLFTNCTSLRILHLGNGSPYISNGQPTGNGIQYLTSIYANDLNQYIQFFRGMNTFSYNTPGASSDGLHLYLAGHEVTSISIPDTVTEIKHCTFMNLRNVTSFTIPSSVTTIGMGAFKNCRGITSIVIPSSVTTLNGTTTGNTGAFSYCTNLSSVTLNEGLTTIGECCFMGCTSLPTITIPSTVTNIKHYAFQNCTGMTGDLVLPSSLTSIGNSAFEGCNGLTSLTISENVTTFGTNIVKGCNNLNTLTILSTATVTGQNLSNASFGFGNLLDIYGNFNKNQGSGVYRFKNIKIRGNMIFGAEYGVCDSDLIETFVCKGNYTSERGWLCHTYNNNNPSHLAFVEIMGTITFGSSNGYVLYSSGACACASGCIIHLGYNGVACTANIARICGNHNNTISRVGKIYVGDGSSQANDQAVLDAYLADSAWQAAPASILDKLDLWYNYTGEYKNL